MSFLCVIPARGGSKSVPKKNIRMIGGKPLICYVIETALDSGAFDEVILSTDSGEIAEAVKERYADISIPFLRPPEFAADDVPVTAVIKHAVDFYAKAGKQYDYVFSVQPTNPFTKAETLKACTLLLKETDCDSVVTIAKIIHYHPFRAYRHDPVSKKMHPLTEYTTEEFLQKQDRPDAFGLTSGALGRKTELISAWNGRGFALGADRRGIVVSDEEALDIDTPFEMEICEAVIELRRRRRSENE